jgi:hypothetical protein
MFPSSQNPAKFQQNPSKNHSTNKKPVEFSKINSKQQFSRVFYEN